MAFSSQSDYHDDLSQHDSASMRASLLRLHSAPVSVKPLWPLRELLPASGSGSGGIAEGRSKSFQGVSKHTIEAPTAFKKHTASQSLHFINITRPKQSKDVGNRKIVRSHVMHEHVRKAKCEQARVDAEKEADCLLADASLANASRQCRCVDGIVDVNGTKNVGFTFDKCQICGGDRMLDQHHDLIVHGWSTATQLIHDPSMNIAALVDPFASFPVQTQAYMHTLIDHFVRILGTSSLPMADENGTIEDLSFEYMWDVMADPASFHGVLLSSSNWLAALSEDNHSHRAKALYHRGELLRLLNKQLGCEDPVVSDAMVASVMTLAGYEIIHGDYAAFRDHLEALDAMIKHKGGLQTLQPEGLLQRTVSWIDQMGATLIGSKPRFLPVRLSTAHLLPPSLRVSITRSTPLALGFRKISESFYFDDEMADVLREMCGLSSSLESANLIPFSSLEMMTFSEDQLSTEHKLLSIRTAENINAQTTQLGDIQECCRLAALLYTNTVFRELPRDSRSLIRLMEQLKLALNQTRLCWGEHANVLLWVLSMMGSVETTDQLKQWFTQLLARVSAELGIKAWADHLSILQQYLWSERSCETLYRKLWPETGLAESVGEG